MREVYLFGKKSQIKQEYLREISDLKKEYFYALALAIKLNLQVKGRQCNSAIIQDLFEFAVAKNIPWSEWYSYLHLKLEVTKNS